MSRYVAGCRMPVGDRIVQRGDSIPEAATWRNLRAWIDQGKILVVEDSPPSSPGAHSLHSGGLRAALIATAADPSSHTARALVALAEAEGVDLPDRMPRSKARVVEVLAGLIGIEV
jgi:hypothetical protein